jgi:hypothetical protein
MGWGKGSSTTYTTPELTPEQKAFIKAQTDMLTGTIAPTYQKGITGATDVYNLNLPGVTNAAQNWGTIAGQAQRTAGETAESALRTGISGLENLFGKDYEQQQLQAALMPAQAQYMQNVAGQNMGFGGAGQMGSARQALANTQLAGQTQASQQAAAANVLRDIAAQRAQVGQALAGFGQSGLGQAVNYAQQGVGASQVPQSNYNQYLSGVYGVPSTAYGANFGGTQGSTQTQDRSGWNIDLSPKNWGMPGGK